MEGTHEVGWRPFMPASTLSGRSVALLRVRLDDCTPSEGQLISHGNCARSLLFLAYRITIIGRAAHSGLLLAMSPPAAKGTAQVFATAITWMSQEKDPAMPAADQASA